MGAPDGSIKFSSRLQNNVAFEKFGGSLLCPASGDLDKGSALWTLRECPQHDLVVSGEVCLCPSLSS